MANEGNVLGRITELYQGNVLSQRADNVKDKDFTAVPTTEALGRSEQDWTRVEISIALFLHFHDMYEDCLQIIYLLVWRRFLKLMPSSIRLIGGCRDPPFQGQGY